MPVPPETVTLWVVLGAIVKLFWLKLMPLELVVVDPPPTVTWMFPQPPD